MSGRTKGPTNAAERRHAAFISALPCVSCRRGPPCHAAHVRMSRADAGKVNAMSRKPGVCWMTPLCWQCHLGDQHGKYGETEFWARLNIDPISLAQRLWEVSGRLRDGLRVIEKTWKAAA